MLIEIKVSLTTSNGAHTINLPQFQNEFDKTLTSMEIFHGKSSEYIITNISSNLKLVGRSIRNEEDIDEINFLAQILSGFYDNELRIFESIISFQGGILSIQKLINIAYNFFDFDIEGSIRTPQDLGRNYVYQKFSNMDKYIFNSINFLNLGMNIKQYQRGKFTSSGYIRNYYLSFENCYNENFGMDFDYGEDYILKLKIYTIDSFKSVEISIPASQDVINRALTRLNVKSLDECIIKRFSGWSFSEITLVKWNDNNIEKLNKLVEKIKLINEHQILDYIRGVRKSKTITCIDSLSFYTDCFNKYLVEGFKAN